MIRTATLEIERRGETVIFTPVTNLNELIYLNPVESEVLNMLSDASIKNVVIDFHNTDYFGSSTLELFLKLWKKASQRKGCLVFCNLSEHESEILNITNLDHFWTICGQKAEAMEMVSN